MRECIHFNKYLVSTKAKSGKPLLVLADLLRENAIVATCKNLYYFSNGAARITLSVTMYQADSRVFHIHTEMPILALSSLLHENKKIQ